MRNFTLFVCAVILFGCNRNLEEQLNETMQTENDVCKLFQLYEEPCLGEVSEEDGEFYRLILREGWDYALIAHFRKNNITSCYTYVSKDISKEPFDLIYHQRSNPQEKIRYKSFKSVINEPQWLGFKSLLDEISSATSDTLDYSKINLYPLIIEKSINGDGSIVGINFDYKNYRHFQNMETFIRQMNKTIADR